MCSVHTVSEAPLVWPRPGTHPLAETNIQRQLTGSIGKSLISPVRTDTADNRPLAWPNSASLLVTSRGGFARIWSKWQAFAGLDGLWFCERWRHVTETRLERNGPW